MLLRSYKLYLILFVFVAMAGTGRAYTPITWVDGNPNNLFAPLCCTSVHNKNKIRTNLFVATQSNDWNDSNTNFGGIAIEGHLALNKLLAGLYAQIYIPTVLAIKKRQEWFFISSDFKKKSYRSSNAAIADIPILLGWTAIKRKRFQLDGYILGIIPTAKHELFHHGTELPYSGFDNHFSWGFGSTCIIRLYGTPRHHLDWITEADVIFHQERKETRIFSITYDGWITSQETPILTKKNGGQLYKIQSGFAYRFKHFIGDLGIYHFREPSIKYYLLDTTLPETKSFKYPEMNGSDLFCDIGWCMQFNKLSSYITLGANYRFQGQNSSRMCGINLKFGIDF